jgi:hypothetical protein
MNAIGLKKLRESLLEEIQNEKIKHDNIHIHFEKKFDNTFKELNVLYLNNKTKNKAKCYVDKINHNKISDGLKLSFQENTETSYCFAKNERNIFDFIWHKTKPRSNNEDRYAMCLGYYGFDDFLNKNKDKIEQNKKIISETKVVSDKSTSSILKEINSKAIILNNFFKDTCYLYVFDQDTADKDSKKKKIIAEYPSIDALVLKKNEENSNLFDLENIDPGNGVKAYYEKGTLEWGAKNKKTINFQFKGHRRDLYLRFHITDSHNPDLIIGKFIFSQGRERRVICGSAILCKNGAKLKEGGTLEVDKAFNYKFKENDENSDKIPHQVKMYLFDKVNNWQKTPQKKFSLGQLDDWLERKLNQHYTKKDIIVNDFLISYPGSSLTVKVGEKEIELETPINKEIEKILSEGIDISLEINRGVRGNFQYDVGSIKKLNAFLIKKNQAEKIEIYTENRKNHPDIYSGNNQEVNLEFFNMINRSFNIVFIIPEFDDAKIKTLEKSELDDFILNQRPSSIYTFIGFCVALKKRTFIFHQNRKKLPIVLKNNCEKLDIYINSFNKMEEIPFKINEELECLKLTSYKVSK